MATTKQSQAIASANALKLIMQQIQSLRQSARDWDKQFSNQGYQTVWNNFPTAALNGDGSLGAPDGAPVNANPINTTVAAMAGLNMSVSATQLANAEGVITAFLTMLDGTGTVAQVNRGSTVDAMAS